MLSIISVVMGIYLIIAYSRIYENTGMLSAESNVAKANQGIYTMGIIFIVAGICFGICNSKCDCTKLDVGSNYFVIFFLLLGIVLVSLSGTIISGTQDGEAKNWAIFTLVFGLIFIVMCSTLLYLSHRNKTGLNFSFY
jgi:cytochrome c biogenesis factor